MKASSSHNYTTRTIRYEPKTIPHEIIEEIFFRLPVKSLLRFKCVCKRWLSTISDPNFHKRESGSVLLTNRETHTFYTIDDDDKALVNDAFSVPWSNSQRHPKERVVISNSCNGLVLVAFGKSLFLFNPSTRYFVKVLTLDRLEHNHYDTIVGLCYDMHANDYKAVVRFALKLPTNACLFVVATCLKTKQWTRISFPFNQVYAVRDGPEVNGLLHWTVSGSTHDEFPFGHRNIVRFDPCTNKFDVFPSPKPKFGNVNVIVGLGILGGRLCMARADNEDLGGVEILTMQEYGVVGSWTSMLVLSNLRLNPYHESLTPLLITKDGEVLLILTSLLSHWKKLFAYNPRTEFQRSIISGFPFVEGVSFVESLVSPAGYGWDPIQHSKLGRIVESRS
ncbi:hypothetical protein LguiB_026677 [Lonicera macranthoides]